MRTSIDIDEKLIGKARRLTSLKTKTRIIHRALEVLVRLETRKDMLRYFASGVWKGDLQVMRRNRA